MNRDDRSSWRGAEVDGESTGVISGSGHAVSRLRFYTETVLITCELTRSAQVYYHSFAEQRFFSLHADIEFTLGAMA